MHKSFDITFFATYMYIYHKVQNPGSVQVFVKFHHLYIIFTVCLFDLLSQHM